MQFSKLRLVGFKSFVEPTELLIEPGTTGIVGPNGCGKSNLVEALRWVMGETSAKRMRGSDMDDVIFAGTDKRPARGWAEVSLSITQTSQIALEGFENVTDLDVVRRIERDQGSSYSANGKQILLRDVQRMFADGASGANSPALVSQGRVGALINAKPQDRRMLLEEAAGVSGLHNRRHEAELRLRAAETNLARVDDVSVALEGQRQSLRKQARQAARYRGMGEDIRKAEALVLWHRWQDSLSGQAQAKTLHEQAEQHVQTQTQAVQGARAARQQILEELPPLRQAESAATTEWQRLTLALEALTAEEQRIRSAQTAEQHNLEQITQDLAREQTLVHDAEHTLTQLQSEDARLAATQTQEEAEQKKAAGNIETLRAGLDDQDRTLAQLTHRVADIQAQRTAAERQISEYRERIATLTQRLDEQRRLLADLENAPRPAQTLSTAETTLAEAETVLEKARNQANQVEQSRQAAEAEAATARKNLQVAETEYTRLKAEVNALSRLLSTANADLFPPLVDALRVTPGFEAAVAAAFGEALTAPLNSAAPIHWRDMTLAETAPALPAGVEPLSHYVQAPPSLTRALNFIGLATSSDFNAAPPSLAAGQIIVTRDGACWRWDGYTVRAGAPTAAAVRLEQRNRLTSLTAQMESASHILTATQAAMQSAAALVENVAVQDQAAREAVHAAFSQVGEARNTLAHVTQAAAIFNSRQQALSDAIVRLEEDVREATKAQETAQAALVQMPATVQEQERIISLRAELAEGRLQLAQHQSTLDQLVREMTERQRRRQAIAHEQTVWQNRRHGAQTRVQELQDRQSVTQRKLEELAARPAALAQEQQAVSEKLSAAEQASKEASTALTRAERRAAEAETEEKEKEESLGNARESRVRAEAAVAAADEAGRQVAARIQERLNCSSEEVAAIAGLSDDAEPPALEEAETKLAKLVRERDSMGPVNLRAEVELEEIEQQFNTLKAEKDDLTAAIAKLRLGISSLNREARERLTTAFETVNKHFKDLFTRLFGGGHAHLSLIEAEDPLDSGLEIFASPPGKKLQVLSLLSGGEQALTALALLFAVFLTNPSPICVLDEVDAPLDDANVERFCALVEDIARTTHTRFLVITHHRLTMARLDRLFGVTMTEKGVSQLVSVNLQQAEKIRAIA